MKSDFQIREAIAQEDPILAEHFYQMWLDNQISPDSIEPNWQNITLEFIAQARKNLSYKAFIAETKTNIIGSTSCQLFSGLYPHILKESTRKYGYIWGVYVTPNYRHQGIGKALTQTAIDYLKSLGCTNAILHASPWGKPVYSQLGFYPTNEMKLDLIAKL